MMQKLTPACRLLIMMLWRKRNYFEKELAEDGSFYYSDKRLAEETGLAEKTIMRAKRFLKENGYIKYVTGRFIGKATRYWILIKPDKKSPFVDISKPDNLALKPDNLPLKAPQNVTPNNINNKEINNSVFNNLSEKQNLEEGIKALAKLKGAAYALKFYVNRGFPEVEVKKILKGWEGGGQDVDTA